MRKAPGISVLTNRAATITAYRGKPAQLPVRRRVDHKRSLEKRGFGRSVIGRAQALRESVRKAFNARRSGVYGSRKILFILAHIIEGSHLLISWRPPTPAPAV
jgi:hypothetical protein